MRQMNATVMPAPMVQLQFPLQVKVCASKNQRIDNFTQAPRIRQGTCLNPRHAKSVTESRLKIALAGGAATLQHEHQQDARFRG